MNLSNLRKRLQGVDVDALLRVTPLDIQWVAAACYLDIVEFSRCLRSSDRHEHRRHELCDRCAPAFSRAVALYRGTFLDGLYLVQCQTYDEWLFMHRERFRVQVLDALEKLTAFHLRCGEGQQALAYAGASAISPRWLRIGRLWRYGRRVRGCQNYSVGAIANAANRSTHSRCSAVSGTVQRRAISMRWKASSASIPACTSRLAASSAERPTLCRQ